MKRNRLVQATIAAFLVLAAGDFLMHGQWLRAFYDAHADWWRPASEMASRRHLVFLSEALLAALLAYIYPKGHESRGATIEQGLRFGVLMGLLLYLPALLMKHVVYPYPTELLVKWFVGGMAQVTAAGVALSWVYGRTR